MECEFDDILKYLEKQEKIINEKEGSHKNVENPLKSKRKDEKLEKTRIETDESKFDKPVKKENVKEDIVYQNVGKRGFDPDRFMSLMRKKLIENDKRYKQYRNKQFLSVTEIIGCPRKVYYSRKDYSEDKYIYPNSLLVLEVGKIIHKTIQNVYPFEKIEEKVISEKFKVKGKFDALVDNSIVELKSIGRDKFTGDYLVEHYHQGIIYAYILNHEFGCNIDNISIVYIIRDLKDKKPPTFNLKLSDSLAEKFLNQALMIHKCLARNIVPSIVNKVEKECQWCSYKKYCKEEGNLKDNKKESKSKFLL